MMMTMITIPVIITIITIIIIKKLEVLIHIFCSFERTSYNIEFGYLPSLFI